MSAGGASASARIAAAAAAFEIDLEHAELGDGHRKAKYVFIASSKEEVQQWVDDVRQCCPVPRDVHGSAGKVAHDESAASSATMVTSGRAGAAGTLNAADGSSTEAALGSTLVATSRCRR